MLVDTDDFLPFLTDDLPGTGGVIKQIPEDFLVEEIPLYEPADQGDHSYLQIEKKNLSTMDALVRIGKALNVPHQQIGYAGLKDAQAVTRQWISVEHLDTDLVENMQLENIKVLQLRRHTNKLKLGHLQANRFAIRIRQCSPTPEVALARTGNIVDRLTQKGVPNFFGPQRFGNRRDSHLLGAAIIQKNPQQFIDMYLGLPDSQLDNSVCFVARSFYEQNELAKAYDAWPVNQHAHRKALRTLINGAAKGLARARQRAFNLMDKRMKRFFVSAFQSDLFNQVLTERLLDLDRLEEGDLAYKHDSGACFLVTDAVAEQPRCRQFEISPTGPLFGYRMAEPQHRPAEIENAVLAQYELTAQDFRQMGYYKVKGTRRPLRFLPQNLRFDTDQDLDGPYLRLEFELPSGCYATTLLREIIKPTAKANSH